MNVISSAQIYSKTKVVNKLKKVDLDDSARLNGRRSLTSVGFILWVPGIYVPNYVAIHPTVVELF